MSTNQTVPLLVNDVAIGTVELVIEKGELVGIARIEGFTGPDIEGVSYGNA